ncbi:two component transcriptional regulator, winged helix family [Granulicella pectinivorans]|jgi:two-component system response regulator CpxR|uniref:Two component transcriptional regulator, winged helix family n=1 Tax=Granulicella pectinivorans TaxID=474950 RepID=A0A1I6M6C3_9BACT|nr:response regulator transcription factor [Granulicella pectinivorans]SFS11163.1 two component transcriptional regulator, winged helix family [Granulicella pectinivorans]
MEDILLIDDDEELCEMLTDYLGRYELRVHAVHRGDTGLEAVRSRSWPIILLDVMLPGIDGFEVLKQIRTFSSDSVLLLTARGEDIDRIVGLEMGADDYMPKPFNARELLARIRAIRRRSAAPAATSRPSALVVEDLVLDPAARTVTLDHLRLDLTDVEFTLLEVLMRSPGKVVERESLAEAVLGRKFSPFDRSLDMHVSRLRKKLAGEGNGDDRVKTVRGTGYQLALLRTPSSGRN